MNSKRLMLTCTVNFFKVNISKEIPEEENLWKSCTWTRNSDKASCVISAVSDFETHIEKCDSSITQRESGVDIMGADRRVCEILIHKALPMDHGSWTCRMEKCKSRNDGGCAHKDSSSCSGQSTIHVAVLY